MYYYIQITTVLNKVFETNTKMERFKTGLKDAVGAIPKDKDSALEAKGQFADHLQKYPSLAKLEELTKRSREEVVGGILLGLFGLLVIGVFIKPLGIFMTRLFGYVCLAFTGRSVL